MRSRLKDIADETGYSVNTVSLALRESSRISESARERIFEVAEQMKYVPNQIARSLVEKRTRTIGVILTDIMNPVLTTVAQHLERELTFLGYTMILVTTGQSIHQEMRALDVLRTRQVDGLLVYPASAGNYEHLRPLHEANYPVVLLAGEADAPLDLVAVDNLQGAYKAVKHFLTLGHTKIAFLNGGRRVGNDQKYRGYIRALEQYGVIFNATHVVTPEGFSYRHGYEAVQGLFQQKPFPTALLASTDQLALGAIRWCKEQSIAVPGQLAVIGFDDTEASRFAEPPLSSVAYAAEQVSSQAIQRLMLLINAKGKSLASGMEKVVIEPEIMMRSTCGSKF